MNANVSLCNDHSNRRTQPRWCVTCIRISMEREIVLKALDCLLEAGYILNTDYGDGPMPIIPTSDRDALVKVLMEGDEDLLRVIGTERTGDEAQIVGWVRFVYGNDGYDVISDYTTNLEAVLKPANDLAEEMQ